MSDDSELYKWIMLSKHRQMVLQLLTKPKIPAEIQRELSKSNYKISLNVVSSTLVDLARKKIAVCITEEKATGRLYKLTVLGERIRNRLLKSAEFPSKKLDSKDIDWELYSWVTRGLQRQAVLRVMHKPMRTAEIRKQARQFNEKLSLNNTIDVLREFVKKSIAIRDNSIFKLSKKGERIREQLLLP